MRTLWVLSAPVGGLSAEVERDEDVGVRRGRGSVKSVGSRRRRKRQQ
jgi:hypothetical protein